jgi:hypothetical protein
VTLSARTYAALLRKLVGALVAVDAVGDLRRLLQGGQGAGERQRAGVLVEVERDRLVVR